MIDKYTIIETLVDNEYKTISLVEYNNTKYILKYAKDIDNINMLQNEVNVLSILNKPKLIEYTNNYIVLEYINAKRLDRIKMNGFKSIFKIIFNILDQLEIIHNNGIIHNDLKPSNILVDDSYNVTIIDFGISIYKDNIMFNNYGSYRYACLDEEKNIKSDIYSLGIIIYLMLTGILPFSGSKEEIKKLKKNNNYKSTEDILLDNIFSKCLSFDSSLRYNNINELRMDLEKYYNIILG